MPWSATGDLALGAPVLVEADHLRLAVDAAEIHHRAEIAALDDLQRIAHRLVVAVVETVLELQVRMRLLHLADPENVLDGAPRRLLAEHMQPTLEPLHHHRRGDVVPEAHEQHVEPLLEQLLPIAPHPHPIDRLARCVDGAIAHGHCLHTRMRVDVLPAYLAGAAVSGDAHTQDFTGLRAHAGSPRSRPERRAHAA
jgi:hypothetical protein